MAPPPDLQSLHLTTSADGQQLTITLDHGRANEMGTAQLAEWETLTEWLEGGAVRTLITTSQRRSRKGTPIFIAGANVTERGGWSDARVRAHVRRQRDVLARLRTAPVFHVAVVDGVALGWGTEFLIVADYRIAAPGARFALPETGLGILPGAGGTSELASLIGVNQALRLGITGERIGPAEAARIGLVDETADSLEAGLERAEALCALASRRSPTAIAAFKRALLAGIGQPAVVRRELEARAYEHCLVSGEAAIGRSNFKRILAGGEIDWNPLAPFRP